MDAEQRIQAAISALQSKSISSIRQAAFKFKVSRSTLQNRLGGVQPIKTSKQSMQRLTPEEEGSIERAIQQLFLWGWPLTIKGLEALATHLLIQKGDLQPLGHCWYSNFLARHPDLKTLWSRTLDRNRKDATNYNTARKWFELFQTTKLLYDINDADIYNIDEKGCMKGIGDNVKVFVQRDEKEVFSIQPGNREWVSIIECISATGYILPPFVIFQGQRIQEDWISNTIDKRTVIQVSPNGWTDNSIGITWIRHFDQHTVNQTKGVHRLLLLDGHASHTSIDFVQYCQDHKIIPLCLPPHSTHYLQPLDVGIFGPLAKSYRTLVSQGAIFGAQRIDNNQFLQYYQQSRKTIAHNIPGAWRGTGLEPFNPDRVLQHLRPPSPPHASLVDGNGRTVTVDGEAAVRINQLVARLMDMCDTPLKKEVLYLKDSALTAIADRSTLTALNQGLVDKATKSRRTRTAKHFGDARVLSVKEIEAKVDKRKVQEAEEHRAKMRRLALKGKVGFVKMVWKEFPVDTTVFD